MRRPLLSFCLTAATATCVAISSAHAAPVLGSHVDSTTFNAALGSTSGWSYLGQSTSAFTEGGQATIVMSSSDWSDGFGYSRTNHGGLQQVFAPGESVGDTGTVAGYTPSYLMYFESTDGLLTFLDGNIQWSDGTSFGGLYGSQGDIDIFRNGSMYAMFYDDGGPSGRSDDNDYNDLVVTFTPNSAVPEPASLGLMGLALAGIGFIRRRKTA